jgi:hypothetical protein
MQKILTVIAVLALMTGLLVGELAAQSSDLPAPRALKRYRVTELEQVLPNARILVRRPFSWLVGAQYGLGLKDGEKLLIVASRIEPLVVQAISVAAEEMGVTTDVLVRDMSSIVNRLGREELDYEHFDPTNYLGFRGVVNRVVPSWLGRMIDDYDVVLGFQARGTHYGQAGTDLRVRSASIDWSRAEQLASAAVSYPDELLELIAVKTWQQYIYGKTIHVTDPLGTDLTFSLDNTNRERFKETRGMATYGELSLDRPIAHEVHPDTEPYLTASPGRPGIFPPSGCTWKADRWFVWKAAERQGRISRRHWSVSGISSFPATIPAPESDGWRKSRSAPIPRWVPPAPFAGARACFIWPSEPIASTGFPMRLPRFLPTIGI